MDLLERYLEKYPEDAERIVLNVKGALKPDLSPAASRDGVKKSIDNCLRLLGPKGRINVYEAARKDSTADYVTETLATIDEYVKSGK